jgi:dTDP-3,4-didehydro-2,6-dideoxy-alpha-D-glucose 3-reductase
VVRRVVNSITPRIAVWGLGKHALNNIVPVLFGMEELSLYGVCSRTERIVSECSKQWNCHGWVDPIDMLTDPGVDIIYLATPIGLHAVQGRQVLESGKHLWCEKPFTCDLADTKMLIKLAEEKELIVTEGFMYLDHPQFARISSFVHKKEMGDIKTITCRFGLPVLENPGFRNVKSLGGGAFWDVGSYTVSAVLALFPDQNIQVLYAERLGEESSSVDNNGRVILRFSNHTTVFLEWHVGCGYRNEIDIWAERGSLFTDKIFSKPADYIPVFRLRNLNGMESVFSVSAKNNFIEMFRRFCRILKNTDMADKEKQDILRRAETLDRIFKETNELNFNQLRGCDHERMERYQIRQ